MNISEKGKKRRGVKRLAVAVYMLTDMCRNEMEVSAKAIIHDMDKKGIHVTQNFVKSVAEDLVECGFGIKIIKHDDGSVEYKSEKDFCEEHWINIIGNLEACKFLTRSQTDKLIDTVFRFIPEGRRCILRDTYCIKNYAKTDNEETLKTIHVIERAMKEGKKISFYIKNPGFEGDIVMHEDNPIVADTIAYIDKDEKSYIVCYDDKHNPSMDVKEEDLKLRNYRLSSVYGCRKTRNKIDKKAVSARKWISDYYYGVFNMFTGTEVLVTLEIPEFMLRSVYDKFGSDIPKQVTRVVDSVKYGTVEIRPKTSKYFHEWVLQGSGDGMKIISPESEIRNYIKFLRKKKELIEIQLAEYEKQSEAAAAPDCT